VTEPKRDTKTVLGLGVLDEVALRETAAWAKRRRASTETASLVGQTVGSYRITRVLGEGGVGIVYLGEHPRVGSRVAIKVLHEDFLDSQEMVARFVQEARAANLVASPHIVGIVDFGTLEDGRDYAVMEYLEGRPLDAVLAESGPLPVARVVDIMSQVAEAMAAAHAVDIVHRDLKPENLFLEARVDRSTTGDFVRILDFGIAKLADPDDGAATTAAGSVLGTPVYCAPEQANGGTVGPKADIYALGAVAYELLTGRTVFQGNAVDVLVSKMTREAPGLGRHDLPHELEALVMQMLERHPDGRPASMSEVRARLGGVVRSAAPPVPTASSQSAGGAKESARERESEPRLPRRRRFVRPASVALVAGLGMVAAAGVVATRAALPSSKGTVVAAPAEQPALAGTASSAAAVTGGATVAAPSIESPTRLSDPPAAAPSSTAPSPTTPPVAAPAPSALRAHTSTSPPRPVPSKLPGPARSKRADPNENVGPAPSNRDPNEKAAPPKGAIVDPFN
jgi:serine/threonine-protein kinase